MDEPMTDEPPPSDNDGPILGIDIGGTKLAVAVATSAGEVLAERRAASRAREGPDAMIGRAVEMAREAVADAALELGEIAAIGIGCGGPLDPWRGIVHNALNNPGWIDVPLVAAIERELGRPAYLDNDANAAALAEHRFGAGRGIQDLVYLTISTGVGGGLILDGRLYHGVNGNAGELGHISVDVAGGRPCHCGSIGCLEAYCSGTNIAARFVEAAGNGETSVLTGRAEVSARDVADAARDGDRLARHVWDTTTTLLGGGIVSIVHAFNPRRVVLGGGVTHAGDILFAPVRRIVRERAMPWLAVRIVPAELGDDVGLIGTVPLVASSLRGSAPFRDTATRHDPATDAPVRSA
jgi:glucokinase